MRSERIGRFTVNIEGIPAAPASSSSEPRSADRSPRTPDSSPIAARDGDQAGRNLSAGSSSSSSGMRGRQGGGTSRPPRSPQTQMVETPFHIRQQQQRQQQRRLFQASQLQSIPETATLQSFGQPSMQQQTTPSRSSTQPSESDFMQKTKQSPVSQTPQQQTMSVPSSLSPSPLPSPSQRSLPPPLPPTSTPSLPPPPPPSWTPSLPPPPPPSSRLQPPRSQPPMPQPLLFTKDMAPAGYSTKFEYLHPESKKILRQIERHILEQKVLSEQLDQCSLLRGSSIAYECFVFDSERIRQTLVGMTIEIEREKKSAEDLAECGKKMLENADVAIRLYVMLGPRFLQRYTGQNTRTRRLNPKRPSLFMENTADRFESYLSECCAWTRKAEKLLIRCTKKTSSYSLEAVPVIMKNAHDYFIHVAAKVENLHQHIECMKTAYVAHLRYKRIRR